MEKEIVGQKSSLFRSVAFYLIALAMFIWAFFPIAWMASTGIKPKADIFASPPKFIFNVTLANFQYIFTLD